MFAAAGLTDRLAVDVQSVQALRAGAARNEPEAVRAVARQFEALLVQNMLKSMRQTSFAGEDDPMADSESMRLYRDLLDQQWAQKISAGRGLGFAEMLVKHLGQPNAAAAAPADAPSAISTSAAPANPQPETAAAKAGDAKRHFLDTLRPHAEAAERATGVPARFILGHAALESGWGARQITGPDGQPSHNLFGIKGGGNWSGAEVEVMTTEYRHGLAVKTAERFRAYDGYAEAFTDYAGLLQRRYGAALEAGADAAGFARALADGGYATDPAYAAKLGRVIASVAAS